MTAGAHRDAAAGGFRLRAAHIPNLLSAARILLVPPLIAALLAGRYRLALVLIVVAGFTDGLDGFLAKRFHWQSRLGGLLDPIADKLLLVGTFLTLTWQGLVPIWLTAVVIGRDVVIVSGGIAYQWLVGTVQPEPSRISKLNTGMQLLFLLLVIAEQGLPVLAGLMPLHAAVLVTGAGVLVTSVVSGLDYVMRWAGRALDRTGAAS